MNYCNLLRKSVLKEIFGVDVVEALIKNMSEEEENMGDEIHEADSTLVNIGDDMDYVIMVYRGSIDEKAEDDMN